MTPALPTEKGAFKAMTRDAKSTKRPVGMMSSFGAISFGHAKTGANVRTYMCIGKKLWLEVRASKHAAHCDIVYKMAGIVVAHDLDKPAAKEYLKKLLVSWPDLPAVH